jgi:hypothetical protein
MATVDQALAIAGIGMALPGLAQVSQKSKFTQLESRQNLYHDQ